MIINWIYNIWRFFWIGVFSILMLLTFLMGLVLLLLQFDPVQERIADYAERSFNEQFHGELRIGSVSGTIPASLRLEDITLEYTIRDEQGESVRTDTVVAASSVDLSLDLYESLFGRFTVTSLQIDSPNFLLQKDERDGKLTFQKAFSRQVPREQAENGTIRDERTLPSIDLRTLAISNGSVRTVGLEELTELGDHITLPSDFYAEDITLRMGIEFSEQQQFFNIREFSGRSDDFEFNSFTFRGQLYADDQFLELNRITLQTPASMIRFNLAFEGVNIKEPDIAGQMKEASVQLRISDTYLTAAEYRGIFPDFPDTDVPVQLEVQAEVENGYAELTQFELRYAESTLIMYGMAENLNESLDYTLALDYVNIHADDFRLWFGEQYELNFDETGLFTLRGNVEGSRHHINPVVELTSGHGSARADVKVSWVDKITYSGDIILDDLNLDAMPSLGMPDTRINATIKFDGEGTELRTADSSLETRLVSSRIQGYVIDELEVQATVGEGFVEPRIELKQHENGGRFRLSGWIDYLKEEPVYNLEGITNDFNPQALYPSGNLQEGSVNSNFTLMATGSDIDTYSGEFYLNVWNAQYGSEVIEDHEFFVFLDEAGQPERTLRIGGTLLEAELKGSIVPSRLIASAAYWSREVKNTIEMQTLYGDALTGMQLQTADITDPEIINNHLTLTAQVDDLRILNKIFPDFPTISTISNLELTLDTTPERIDIRTVLYSDFVEMDGLEADSLVARTHSVFYRNKITDFYSGTYDIQLGRMTVAGREFRDIDIFIDGYDEAFVLQRFTTNTGEDVELGMMLSAVFSSRDVDIRIMDFYIGDEEYTWRNIRETPITIDDSGRFHIDRLEFGNLQERFIIDGTFSESPDDSVTYLASGLELERISGIIGGRVSFSGLMDGTFVTRSLRTNPEFQGDMRVETFTLDDRLIGDVGFRSRFNTETQRFDTRLTVKTDQERHARFLAANEDIGQDIVIEGYFNALGRIDEVDEIANFDVTLNEVDLWILPLIVEGVFDDMQGRAKGEGNIQLRTDGIHFDSEFEAIDVRLRPVFLLSDLILNGRIGLNSDTGVILHDIDVRDTRNGSGVLSGAIGLNLFEEGGTVFDIDLEMNNLMFLNNRAGPEVPFFGRGVGSGTVRLSGTNDQPFISTPSPVVLTSNSQISVPVSTDPSVEGGTRFIQFVEDFEDGFDFDQISQLPNGNNNQQNGQNGDETELTFMERFGFDLQFVANENMTVRLIFDEVTSEILSARGTGRIRITLQDEVMQVFGRFDVAGGDYLFVGGDIFSRRFTIREGGTISWEGDPVNANIDVSAVYRARPNINILRDGFSADDTPVRVPVDLVLEITGALDSIENEFYFEFPSTADISQTTAILARLRDDDIKLLQATSVLLTGNFTPIDTQLNELFTSQIGAQGLGTLLSSQITSILNSNISNIDVDLNLSTFEEADLGIALRLFDDRLTLRREGTISGPNSNIGDFDVRYQINRYFAVEAFMRREQLLPSAVSVGQTQSDETYGVGVEARVQFNTWQELRNRVWGAVRGLFTSRKEDDETSVAQSD